MPKSEIFINKVLNPDNLRDALVEACRYHKNKNHTNYAKLHAVEIIENIIIDVCEQKYKVSPYNEFTLVSSGKVRKIKAPAFRDVIFQHSITRILEPMYEKIFIDQAFANRKGKGTGACNKYVQETLKKIPTDRYYVQFDIHKYFDSIDISILKKELARNIRDKYLIDLLCQFSEDGIKGLPLGNITSQFLGNIYGNKLDRFVKHKIKAKYYCRYVDDFVIFNIETKEQAVEIKNSIIEFLKNEMNMELSKCIINKNKHGINYTGYIHRKNQMKMRPRNIKSFKKKLKHHNIDGAVAILGMNQDSSSFNLLMNHYCEFLKKEKVLNSVI